MLKRALRETMRPFLGRPSMSIAVKRPSPMAYAAMRAFNGIMLGPEQIALIAETIAREAPCHLLVFGLGNDSLLWETLNEDGRTVFLESDETWFDRIRSREGCAGMEVHLVEYGTRRSEWCALLDSPSKLQMDLPQEVSGEDWDIVLVDGPAGHTDASPGRMKSIYAASRLVSESGCAFVHDCEREVESAYCKAFLGDARLAVEVPARSGLLRQYRMREVG